MLIQLHNMAMRISRSAPLSVNHTDFSVGAGEFGSYIDEWDLSCSSESKTAENFVLRAGIVSVRLFIDAMCFSCCLQSWNPCRKSRF